MKDKRKTIKISLYTSKISSKIRQLNKHNKSFATFWHVICPFLKLLGLFAISRMCVLKATIEVIHVKTTASLLQIKINACKKKLKNFEIVDEIKTKLQYYHYGQIYKYI